jgi:hypothetical protein
MPGKTPLDADGQPLSRRLNAARLSDRAVDELIGLCRGVEVDGAVSTTEAEFLREWIECNRAHAGHRPANILYARLTEMLVDDVLDPMEERELLELLHDIVGGGLPVMERVASYSSTLPLCAPPPAISFPGRRFCMTGKFVFGTRKQCEAAIMQLGGETQSTPTSSTSFLVIGAIGSRDWIHSTHGRKIEAAVKLREQGTRLAIVSEEHWAKHVMQAAA